MAQRQLRLLFLIIFLGMVGYGLVVPLVPLFALKLGVSETFITWVVASYALGQFAGAPVWGWISDRYGRRPVLMLTVAGSIIGYILLALADTLWLLVLARAVGGFSAGNLTTAFAYIADTTDERHRPRAIGRVSAAFSLGFMVGPAIGGLLAGGTDLADANFARPALVAAAMSAAALVGTYLFLPESRPAGLRRRQPKRQRAAPLTISRVLTARPVITILALVTFLSFVTSSVRESILALWIASQLDFGPQAIGLIFSWNGIVVTSTQGFLIGPLAERFGERVVLRLGLSAYLIGLVGLMTSPDLPVFLISTTLNAFGTGAFASALPTMFSGHAAEGERGQIIAVYQSTGSLSRFIGPTFSGALYQIVGISAPFAFGVCALAVGLALTFLLPGATSGATKQSSGGRSGTQNPPPPPKP